MGSVWNKGGAWDGVVYGMRVVDERG